MRYFIIILTIFPLLSFGQTNSAIEQTAKELSGTWLLERYELDSLVRTQDITGNKFVEKTFILGELTKKEESEGGYVIELSFKSNGQGSHQEYYEYQLEPLYDWMEINTCQPVPELMIEDNKVIIHMTYMMGEGTETIVELTANSLELLDDNGIRRTFKRLK
jgi:hypothetical protein